MSAFRRVRLYQPGPQLKDPAIEIDGKLVSDLISVKIEARFDDATKVTLEFYAGELEVELDEALVVRPPTTDERAAERLRLEGHIFGRMRGDKPDE